MMSRYNYIVTYDVNYGTSFHPAILQIASATSSFTERLATDRLRELIHVLSQHLAVPMASNKMCTILPRILRSSSLTCRD